MPMSGGGASEARPGPPQGVASVSAPARFVYLTVAGDRRSLPALQGCGLNKTTTRYSEGVRLSWIRPSRQFFCRKKIVRWGSRKEAAPATPLCPPPATQVVHKPKHNPKTQNRGNCASHATVSALWHHRARKIPEQRTGVPCDSTYQLRSSQGSSSWPKSLCINGQFTFFSAAHKGRPPLLASRLFV